MKYTRDRSFKRPKYEINCINFNVVKELNYSEMEFTDMINMCQDYLEFHYFVKFDRMQSVNQQMKFYKSNLFDPLKHICNYVTTGRSIIPTPYTDYAKKIKENIMLIKNLEIRTAALFAVDTVEREVIDMCKNILYYLASKIFLKRDKMETIKIYTKKGNKFEKLPATYKINNSILLKYLLSKKVKTILVSMKKLPTTMKCIG